MNESVELNAKAAYERYADSVRWETSEGIPLVQWEQLPERAKQAWMAAVEPIVESADEARQALADIYDRTLTQIESEHRQWVLARILETD